MSHSLKGTELLKKWLENMMQLETNFKTLKELIGFRYLRNTRILNLLIGITQSTLLKEASWPTKRQMKVQSSNRSLLSNYQDSFLGIQEILFGKNKKRPNNQLPKLSQSSPLWNQYPSNMILKRDLSGIRRPKI